jgi:hypothetical protein
MQAKSQSRAITPVKPLGLDFPKNDVGCLASLKFPALKRYTIDKNSVQIVAPHNPPQREIAALLRKIQSVMNDVRLKHSTITIQELRRLLYRCAAVLTSLDHVRVISIL